MVPTQLSLDVSYSLLTGCLVPQKLVLDPNIPPPISEPITLSTHSALCQVVVVPPPAHFQPSLERHGFSVIGVSNELPPLHPVYPLCLCMCAVWRWAAPLGMHGGISCSDQRDKEREQRLREARARPGESRNNLATETTTRHSQRAADGSAVSTVTKTERLVHSSKTEQGLGLGASSG